MAGFGLGAVWFLPRIFGDAWMQALGKTKQDLGSPAKALIVAFITTTITAIIINFILIELKSQGVVLSVWDGIWTGLLLGAGVYGVTVYSDSIFCDWPGKVVMIQIGYSVIKLMLMGVILTSFI